MDKLLSLVDQATSRFGVFNTVLDRVVERVVPQTTAAACGGVFCGAFACVGMNTICEHDLPPSQSYAAIYSSSQTGCYYHNITCYQWTGDCCY